MERAWQAPRELEMCQSDGVKRGSTHVSPYGSLGAGPRLHVPPPCSAPSLASSSTCISPPLTTSSGFQASSQFVPGCELQLLTRIQTRLKTVSELHPLAQLWHGVCLLYTFLVWILAPAIGVRIDSI